VRERIADHGLVVADLDPLLRWLPDEVIPPGVSAATEEEFYVIAEAVGARSLNVAQGFGARVDLDRAADALAGVCDRARAHGLLVTLEYLPWSGIPDAATALAIVERSGRANATLMIDTWHTFRGPTDEAQLEKLPGARIGGVQLNDAPAAAAPDLVAETLSARLLPGEGAIPLVSWLRILDASGNRAPLGVEVFSKALDALPPIEVGRRCGAAARAVLAAARAQSPA
jgi:sugar phosphate isomerase/epimerase